MVPTALKVAITNRIARYSLPLTLSWSDLISLWKYDLLPGEGHGLQGAIIEGKTFDNAHRPNNMWWRLFQLLLRNVLHTTTCLPGENQGLHGSVRESVCPDGPDLSNNFSSEKHIVQWKKILLQCHLCMVSMYYDMIIHILLSLTRRRSGTSAKCIQKRHMLR